MPHEPLSPASFAAIAKATLGWEHPNIIENRHGMCYGDRGNWMQLTDADALDLLAAGAWRRMQQLTDEREDDTEWFIERDDPRMDEWTLTTHWHGAFHFEIDTRWWPDATALYKLLCALHDAGVRDGK